MFGPIPESNTPMDVTATEANEKRKGMKSPTDEEEVPEGDSKLVKALARLALQHENERRAHARDDNVVFSMPSSGALAKGFQWADQYAEDRCSAQEGPMWCIFVCHPHLTIIICCPAVWAQACGLERKTSNVIIVHLWFI